MSNYVFVFWPLNKRKIFFFKCIFFFMLEVAELDLKVKGRKQQSEQPSGLACEPGSITSIRIMMQWSQQRFQTSSSSSAGISVTSTQEWHWSHLLLLFQHSWSTLLSFPKFYNWLPFPSMKRLTAVLLRRARVVEMSPAVSGKSIYLFFYFCPALCFEFAPGSDGLGALKVQEWKNKTDLIGL